MTAYAQNFSAYVGDAALPIFLVVDQANNPINIASVSDIQWSASRTTTSSPVLTKSKLGGQIGFVTNGTDGQFKVQITGSDTAGLSGVYLHQALIIDGLGNQTTVTLGQMTIGRAPSWTYDPTQLATNPLMQVRRLIGDTKINDQQQWDEEIAFALAQRGNSIWGAAAECCRNLASEMSRQVDVVQGELKTNYSNRAKAYLAMMRRYEMIASARSGGVPYAGGISIADKRTQQANTNRVSPNFTIGMTDNFVLGGGGGPQTETLNNELPDF